MERDIVRTDRDRDSGLALRVAVGDQLFREKRAQIVRTNWATVSASRFRRVHEYNNMML